MQGVRAAGLAVAQGGEGLVEGQLVDAQEEGPLGVRSLGDGLLQGAAAAEPRPHTPTTRAAASSGESGPHLPNRNRVDLGGNRPKVNLARANVDTPSPNQCTACDAVEPRTASHTFRNIGTTRIVTET